MQRRDCSESRSREWIDNEMVGREFEDVRHRKRLRQLLEQLTDPGRETTFVSICCRVLHPATSHMSPVIASTFPSQTVYSSMTHGPSEFD